MIRKDEIVIRIPSSHDQNLEKAVQIIASAANMIRITSVHDQNPEKAVQIVERAASMIRFH